MELKNEIYRYIIDHSTNGIIVADENYDINYANEMACCILDTENSNIIGKKLDEYFDIKYNNQNINTKRYSTKVKYKDKVFLVDLLNMDIANMSRGVVIIFQDISKYEYIVDELNKFKELNDKLEAIINSSYDGIYVTDGEANTVMVNRAYEKITGISADMVIGHNMKELVEKGFYSQSGSLVVLKKNAQVTLRQRLLSGKEILVTSTPVFDRDGNRKYIVTNVRDITDLIKLQGELSETKMLNERYRSELEYIKAKSTQQLVFSDKVMKNIIELIIRISQFDTTVLLLGETGVGKGEIAKFIHNNSKRRENNFIEINCGAIPQNLFESELFGYEKGSFTGASKNGKIGLLELANKGTVFLDEVSELPLDMQVKLLKVIQDKVIYRVGGLKPILIDIRIISASNKDLKEMVNKGTFREDLYYRLSVFPIKIPPLKERKDDIVPLALSFLNECNEKYHMNKYFKVKIFDILKRYEWPGNIRELRNFIEWISLSTPKDEIDEEYLPNYIYDRSSNKDIKAYSYDGCMSLKEALLNFEECLIVDAIKKYGSIRKASKHLGVNPSTLSRKIKNMK